MIWMCAIQFTAIINIYLKGKLSSTHYLVFGKWTNWWAETEYLNWFWTSNSML